MEIGGGKRRRALKHEDGKVSCDTGGCGGLQFYAYAPTDIISLQEFEEFAVERVKVLHAVETVGIKHMRGTDVYELTLAKDIKKTALKGLTRQEEVDAATMRMDYISHFILRLAYGRSEDSRRWFLQQELDLFRYRFMKTNHQNIQQFLQANNLHYKPIDAEEKQSCLDNLIASTYSPSSVPTMEYYKVPFTEALELVRGRKVYLENGFAYVPHTDLVTLVLSHYRTHLSHALTVTSRALPYLEEDSRLVPLLKSVSSGYQGQDYNPKKISSGAVTADMIDGLAKTSFPPCMQHLHQSMKQHHHLRHYGRMQYGLFLKGIGVSLEQALKFWRIEFTKAIDVDKFDKQYSYNIRHNYGKEGKRTDYTPYSCVKIIVTNTPGPGDFHGCPFRHSDAEMLQQRLRSQGMSKENYDSVLQHVKGGHYQLACARYFEITQCKGEDTGVPIHHPNQYFDEAQKVATGTPAISRSKPATSSSVATPSQPPASTPQQSDNLDD